MRDNHFREKNSTRGLIYGNNVIDDCDYTKFRFRQKKNPNYERLGSVSIMYKVEVPKMEEKELRSPPTFSSYLHNNAAFKYTIHMYKVFDMHI